jgi:hypothetical protein
VRRMRGRGNEVRCEVRYEVRCDVRCDVRRVIVVEEESHELRPLAVGVQVAASGWKELATCHLPLVGLFKADPNE